MNRKQIERKRRETAHKIVRGKRTRHGIAPHRGPGRTRHGARG